jgi:FKBP-type peptidyl-prolyl cis-trans isomerase (trigger factor)
MKYTTARLADNSIELTITIPWVDIEKIYEEVVVDFVKNAEISGFRKGKAPRDIVEKSLDKGKVYEEVVRRIIPKAYSDALTQEKLHPIVMPKIELKEATEKKDWVIKAITAEKPLFELGDYKKAIKELADSKAKKLWVPGQDTSTGSAQGKEEMQKKPSLDEILMTLFGTVKATIPEILIENETNRLLSDLIDQTKKLGMSVEQYLSSTHETSESIRDEYKQQAIRTITLEFALEEIADKEGLLVSDDEIQKAIDTAKTPEEKKALEGEKYYLATILRRQKTLDFLAAL